MSAKSRPSPKKPIGEILRRQRIEVLNKGLREMARALEIAPAHLTDIEKGRRAPSEELLVRIVAAYQIDEAELRTGWSKPDTVVGEIASQDATTARKVPEFLRTARKLNSDQWDALIEQARQMTSKKPKKTGR